MKSDRKAAIKKLKNLVLTPKMDPDEYCRNLEDTFSSVFLPNNVECSERNINGVRCDVVSPVVYSSRRIIIYIHGGSFIGGTSGSYRNFCASLANASCCRIVIPDFRKAPTHPFPASIDDLVAVFRAIYEEETVARSLEASASHLSPSESHAQIIVAADGSGASMAMAVVLKINKKYRNNIQTMLLFSPWLDLTSDNPIIGGKKVSDEIMSGASLHRAVDMYTYATNISNPHVSCLQAPNEDFEQFPPVFIQMGERKSWFSRQRPLRKSLRPSM
ncbi:MAG: alpha/beta hydrolase fold domain-containing protein [Treponema sp.]|nr:alpha/beta hydrolase fold domain-containing protein [Treponema sp.]